MGFEVPCNLSIHFDYLCLNTRLFICLRISYLSLIHQPHSNEHFPSFMPDLFSLFFMHEA